MCQKVAEPLKKSEKVENESGGAGASLQHEHNNSHAHSPQLDHSTATRAAA